MPNKKMNRIALLTSDNRRHRWVAARLAEVAEVACVISEVKPPQGESATGAVPTEIAEYFASRCQAEERWFRDVPELYSNIAHRVLEFLWQGVNSGEAFELLREVEVDRVFLFGSSIVRDPILSHFRGRIVNMHLGLSPYYRGSSTNFWPLVDGLPECVGVTIHHATDVVDGGGILAQARPFAEAADSIHDLGCKAIIAGATLLQWAAKPALCWPQGWHQNKSGKLCRRAEFSIESLQQAQYRMAGGLLNDYLADKTKRDARYPIIELPPDFL
jgi:methionyl-tRNA formyltransferase